tara:strand:+ start:13612 stop:14511 length:900 start_codon:yes stop_codon:yes gene_type:complete
MYLTIFGTSKITIQHIKSLKKNNIKLFSISTFRNKNQKIKIKKIFKQTKIFHDYKFCIRESLKIKDCHFVITSSIQNNKILLNELCKYDRKILIEKPVFLKSNEFNKYFKFNDKIFVGYNRIFYKNINYLKNYLKNKTINNILIKIPETNRSNILLNSCHVISILVNLFGKIKPVKIIKAKKYIFAIFQTQKKYLIFFNFNFGSPENFSINISQNNKFLQLKPIEKLNVYKGMNISKLNSINTFRPNIVKTINEFDYTKNKPGFDEQYKNFKKFIYGKKSTHIDMRFAKEIIKTCNLFL